MSWYEVFVSISAIIINHIQIPLRLLGVFHIDHTNTKAVFDKGPLDDNDQGNLKIAMKLTHLWRDYKQ